MTNKPNPFEHIGDLLKKGFSAAGKGTDQGLNKASQTFKTVLDVGEKLAEDHIENVENVVGKGRLRGAMVGAKYGVGAGMFFGIPGMVKFGVGGAVLGAVLGEGAIELDKKIRGVSNDNPPPAEDKKPDAPAPPPAAKGPDDPAP